MATASFVLSDYYSLTPAEQNTALDRARQKQKRATRHAFVYAQRPKTLLGKYFSEKIRHILYEMKTTTKKRGIKHV